MRPCLFLPVVLFCAGRIACAVDLFTIEVIDSQTGRGVPLVELTPSGGPLLVTDSNGIVAVDDPALLNQNLFVDFRSFGYSDAGQTIQTTPGANVQVAIDRQNLAERLYRITGAGIYEDSVKAGIDVPIDKPLLNANVIGQDSTKTAIYKNKIYWFWGDTGFQGGGFNFRTSGATSELPDQGGLDPSLGVNLNYFTAPNGNAKGMVPMSDPGLVWVDGTFTVPDNTGQERLLTRFSRVEGDFTLLEHGLGLFNDTSEIFERFQPYDLNAPIVPKGRAFRHTVDGQEYIYFAGNYPNIRVKADWDHVTDISTWEAFTPLQENSRYSDTNPPLDLDDQGNIVFGWKQNTDPIDTNMLNDLVAGGHLDRDESPFRLEDHATGDVVHLHGASVEWNEYRQSWVMIGLESFGDSLIGEVWFSEAATPEGPWEDAIKVVTHHRIDPTRDNPNVTYSFYNVIQHPYFAQEDGRYIYFEGTYSAWLSTEDENPTPLYDYNQIMYRLDLATIPSLIEAEPQLPGDFDGDGDVDGADFVVWQTNFPTESGATLATGDADGDGDVDGADFVIWQTNFPTSPGGAAAVPEPQALALALLAVLGGWMSSCAFQRHLKPDATNH